MEEESIAVKRPSLFKSKTLLVTIDPRIERYFEEMDLEVSEAFVRLLGRISRGQASKKSFHYMRTHKGLDVFRGVLPCGSFFDGFYPSRDRREFCIVVAVQADSITGTMRMHSLIPETLNFKADGSPL